MNTRAMIVAGGLTLCGLAAIAAVPKADAGAPAIAASPAAASEWGIDAVHSSMVFRVSHLGLTNFYGRFNKMSGSFVFDPDAPESANFDVTIDADSVDSNNSQRDAHLRNADFFSVKEFPTLTFKSTRATKVGDAYELAGELTMLGVTKPVTAKLTWGGMGDKGPRMGVRCGVEATFTIKRSEFNMNYGVEGGTLGDDVMVIIALAGAKK